MPEESRIRNLIIYAAAAIVLLYGVYNFVYRPVLKEINNLQSSLKLINSEIKTIDGGELLLKDPAEARAVIKKELDALSVKMPSETDAPYLVDKFITIVGRGLNIDYNLIQPSTIVAEKNYKRLPLKVEFEGDYANLNTYLSQLKNLPVAIRVDSMELKKAGDTSKLSVRMGLSAFMMPGGPAIAETPGAAEKPFAYNYYDPFITISDKKEAPKSASALTGLRYSGYWRGTKMRAIINDEIYAEGQTVLGYRVVKIYREKVILTKSGRKYELPLGGNK